jgi:hypothetical protein
MANREGRGSRSSGLRRRRRAVSSHLGGLRTPLEGPIGLQSTKADN